MSLFNDLKNRRIQKKANNFIESLKTKSEKEIEQAYLDNKEFENNEIVLSYLFFNHTSLIRILPLDFQISRLNSNLNMFEYGSSEAKRKLVSSWLKDNKFFMNALVLNLSDEEYNSCIKLYFHQPEDITLLHMDDLKKVIEILSQSDLKQTEEIINLNKDKFTDRQWEFIIEVNPSFIKYASQNIQNEHSEEEKYVLYLSGEARKKYVSKQIEKIKEDITLFDNASVDIQKEYIEECPYMINYLKDEVLIDLLKYDIELIRYVNLSLLKNENDKTQEVVCGILENIEHKSNKELVNVLINKCLLNAKGKLYRFDNKSNDISYQYTKRVIKLLQNLTTEQVIALLLVDSNYILPYVVPVYNADTKRSEKEKIVIDCNSRCLNVFKVYYGEELYNKYYKVINKIYNEYLANIDKYDYNTDYRCIFELLKVLFNKRIISSNSFEKVSLFIGTSILYKDIDRKESKQITVKLLNELLKKAYGDIKNNKELYNIGSLELFDSRLSFIDEELLNDYSKYNFVNISNLLLIIKSEKAIDLFKEYYEIITHIYGKNKETLYKAVENFNYYIDILEDVKGKDLSDEELDNLVLLLSTFSNPYNITKKEELEGYDIVLYKKLISELSSVKNEDMYRNLLCNYLFSKGYDDRGNTGWLEIDTIKSLCDVYEVDALSNFSVNDENPFSEEEIELFRLMKLLFSDKDYNLMFSFIDGIITNKIKRNILCVSNLFNKIKKYRVALINNTIVSLDEIEDLYKERPDIVIKNTKDGVDVYTIVGQDFKVLYSLSDDGIHYGVSNVSLLEKNMYGYSRLESSGSVRFTTVDNKTIVKLNKDNINSRGAKKEFIIVVNKLTDELVDIAKRNNLKIVEIQTG